MPVPPPYGLIVDELSKGLVVPFLGAGVNFGHRPSNARWSQYGAPFLSPGDIVDGPGLIAWLRQNDQVAGELLEKFSHPLRDALEEPSLHPVDTGTLVEMLVHELNRMIQAPYDPGFLAGANIPSELRQALVHLHGDTLHAMKRQILSDLFPDYVAPWCPTTCNFLPSGAELSRFLAGRAEFPSSKDSEIENLAKTASYLVETSRRKKLREYLHDLLDRDYPPCPIHQYLAGVSATLKDGVPMVIVTTNYDDLLERAFADVEAERREKNLPSRPFDIVVHPTDDPANAASVLVWRHGARAPEHTTPGDLYIDLKSRTVIYKMHGSVVRAWQRGDVSGSVDERDDSYVITEEDYIDFLSKMTAATPVPHMLMRHFSKCYFLFLGYGLADWNLRVLLRNLKLYASPEEDDPAAAAVRADKDSVEDVNSPSSWSIQHQPSELERTLWAARRVHIYDIDINDFAQRLSVQSRLAGALK
jgi:hypothetical protein